MILKYVLYSFCFSRFWLLAYEMRPYPMRQNNKEIAILRCLLLTLVLGYAHYLLGAHL